MTLNYLVIATCVAFGLAHVFAVMTWRRILARRSLMLGLTAIVFLLILVGKPHPWLAIITAAVCVAVIALLVAKEIGERRPTHIYQQALRAYQQSPIP